MSSEILRSLKKIDPDDVTPRLCDAMIRALARGGEIAQPLDPKQLLEERTRRLLETNPISYSG